MDSYSIEVAASERRRQALEAAELRWLLRSAALEPRPRRWSPARLLFALTHRLAGVVGVKTRRTSRRSFGEWVRRWERGR